MWRETRDALDGWLYRVNEGKCLMEAADFSKFVFNCGLVKLFKENSSPEPLKVDGAFIEWQCGEILRVCAERWKNPALPVSLSLSVLEDVNRKLDLVAAELVRLDCIAGYRSKLVVNGAGARSAGVAREDDAAPASPLPFSLLTEGGFGESDETKHTAVMLIGGLSDTGRLILVVLVAGKSVTLKVMLSLKS